MLQYQQKVQSKFHIVQVFEGKGHHYENIQNFIDIISNDCFKTKIE